MKPEKIREINEMFNDGLLTKEAYILIMSNLPKTIKKEEIIEEPIVEEPTNEEPEVTEEEIIEEPIKEGFTVDEILNGEDEEEITKEDLPIENIEVKNKGFWKRNWKKVTAAVLAGGIIIGGLLGLKSCKDERKQTSISQKAEDSDEVNDKIMQLNEGIQRYSFLRINQVSKFFNTELSKKLYREWDNENNAYISAREMASLFVIANSNQYSAEEFYEIFETSDYMEKSFSYFTGLTTHMVNYYSRLEEHTQLENLFKNERDRNNYSNFETLIVEYNKADENTKEQVKNQIRQIFENIRLQTSEERRATLTSNAFILTYGAPWANKEGIINEETLNTLVEINETELCDYINIKLLRPKTEEVKELEKTKEKTNASNVVKELLGNPEIATKDDSSLLDRKYIKYEGRVFNNKPVNEETDENTKSNNAPWTTYEKSKSITREEAVSYFGEEAVKEAEKKARDNATVTIEDPRTGETTTVTIDEANKKEEERKDLIEQVATSKIYEEAYSYIENNGVKPSVDMYVSKYGYTTKAAREAIENTINNAWNDYQENKRRQEEFLKNNDGKVEKETEEFIPAEEVEDNNQTINEVEEIVSVNEEFIEEQSQDDNQTIIMSIDGELFETPQQGIARVRR